MTRVFRAADNLNGFNGGAFNPDVLEGTGLTTFTHGGLNLLDDAGIYQPIAANDPPVYYFNNQWWLYTQPSMTHAVLRNRTFATSWGGSAQTAQNATGLDGVTNSAATLTDSGATSEDRSQTVTVLATGQPITFKYWIKKDGAATHWIGCRASNAAEGALIELMVNPATGAGSWATNAGAVPGAAFEVRDVGLWWEVLLQITNNGVATTTRINLYPASSTDGLTIDGTVMGSSVVDSAEIHDNKTIAEIRGTGPLFTGASGVTSGVCSSTYPSANHADAQGAWYAEVTALGITAADGPPSPIGLGTNGRLINADNTNFNSFDGTLTTTVVFAHADDAKVKVGLAYGTLKRLTVDGSSSSEDAYDGVYNNTNGLIRVVNDVTTALPAVTAGLIRNIRRYDDSYTAAKAQIDALMAGTEDSDLAAGPVNRPDKKYAAVGGPPGHIDDLEIAYLQAEGATSDNVNDAWREVLTVKGFTTGNFNTDLYAYLGSLGHTGALPDRLSQFWISGG